MIFYNQKGASGKPGIYVRVSRLEFLLPNKKYVSAYLMLAKKHMMILWSFGTMLYGKINQKRETGANPSLHSA